jgi:hypothetical protein
MRIFVPQLEASEVAPIFKRHRWRKPQNISGMTVARWHHGIYYQYGNKASWFPLNSMGGIATKAFHGLTVTFPPAVESDLLALLDEKKRQSRKRKLST